MRLSDKSVQSLKPPERGVKVYSDETVTGFGVRCSQGGGKSYVLTLPGAGRTRVTIGKVGLITLAEARVVAKRMLAEETLGKHRPPRLSFGDALATFMESRKQRNRPKTALETEKLLRNYFKPLHAMQLTEIRAHHITDITDGLSRKGLQSTAAHAHTAAHTFLRFCSQRHYIPFNPIADVEKPALPKPRERVLSDDELRTVWAAADKQGHPFGDIVKLLILTGQRRTEIGSLRQEWCSLSPSEDGARKTAPPAPLVVGGEDIALRVEMRADGEDNPEHVSGPRKYTENPHQLSSQCTITFPSTITKNKRAHTFPIGQLSLAVLRSLNSDISSNARVLFLARGSDARPFNGWSKAKAQLDKEIEKLTHANQSNHGLTGVASWTLHDLRRTLATNWQRLGIRLEVIEAYLNHVSGTRAGIVGTYHRHKWEDEMREAVAAYEKWFEATIIKP